MLTFLPPVSGGIYIPSPWTWVDICPCPDQQKTVEVVPRDFWGFRSQLPRSGEVQVQSHGEATCRCPGWQPHRGSSQQMAGAPNVSVMTPPPKDSRSQLSVPSPPNSPAEVPDIMQQRQSYPHSALSKFLTKYPWVEKQNRSLAALCFVVIWYATIVTKPKSSLKFTHIYACIIFIYIYIHYSPP